VTRRRKAARDRQANFDGGDDMKNRAATLIASAALFLGCCVGSSYVLAQSGTHGGSTATGAPDATGAAGGDAGISGAVEQKPLLTPAQRTAIYAAVSKDKSKTSPKDFSPTIGTAVPPMIELYTLPDDAIADAPGAKDYKYTMVENKVVVVDPTKMRVVDVIGPAQAQ
jgi:hypothetical protein